MTLGWTIAHVCALLALPVVVTGVINRTKARWAGRMGAPILQTLYDLVRLLRKRPVYSATTTPLFWVAPYVVLATAAVAGLIVPLLGVGAPITFPFDFVFFAYILGLGRLALMLAALDTGSAFEGMGASREATFSALIEPAMFLGLGTLAGATGDATFAGMLRLGGTDAATAGVRVACLIAFALVLQVESARMPIDDPTTHLELTMVHEVMILDHSGPDLAAMQYAAALKLVVGSAILAAVLNPLGPEAPATWVACANVALVLAVAVAIGTVESLTSRLRLNAVPRYILIALAAGALAVLMGSWRAGASA